MSAASAPVHCRHKIKRPRNCRQCRRNAHNSFFHCNFDGARSGATPDDFRVLPRKIILVRHAESEGNVDNYACARRPPILSYRSSQVIWDPYLAVLSNRQPSPPARVPRRYTYVPDMQVPLVRGAQSICTASNARPFPEKPLRGRCAACRRIGASSRPRMRATASARSWTPTRRLFRCSSTPGVRRCWPAVGHDRPSPFQHTDKVAICAQMRQCCIIWCAEALQRLCGRVSFSCMGWRVHGVGAA